jgi:tight adherence protein C
VVAPLVESFGRRLASLLPSAFVRRTERRLVVAGQPMRPAAFFALALAVASLLALGYLALALSLADGPPPAGALLLAPFVLALGAFMPVFWLSARARARQSAMSRALPDSLDLLTVCVEAGLGLDAAFRQVAEKQGGPLADEIRQMLRQLAVGKSRREALLDLGQRTGLDDVRSFANVVIQAEQLGTSLARVLRAQAQRLRVRRRQRAEQEARRAPVKMVFPLVFCLMPSLFIFILGPIIVTLVDFLSGT